MAAEGGSAGATAPAAADMTSASSEEMAAHIQKQLAAQRAQEEKEALEAGHRLQRMSRLEAMIRKRKENFQYLKQMHQGGSYWLNCVLLSRSDLVNFVRKQVNVGRVRQFYYLGVSASKLLPPAASASGTPCIRAMSQLFEEWEYHFSNSALQGVRSMMARQTQCVYPALEEQEDDSQPQPQHRLQKQLEHQHRPDDEEDLQQNRAGDIAFTVTEPIRPTLFKFHSNVVYQYLITPPIPFQLDYFEIVFSLCDILCNIYENFKDTESYSNKLVYDALVKLDSKIKHYVVNLIAKEFTEFSLESVKSELTNLRAGVVL